MTTDHKELCERLRTEDEGSDGFYSLLIEAAELIEAQAKQIAELQAQLERSEKAVARYAYLRRRAVMVDCSNDAASVLTLFVDEGPTGEFLDDWVDGQIAALSANKGEQG